ncbi:hypothetical protein X275_08995 [Marinitoga sp. 1197]|uniref:sensor domain-containing diguanylate cyclase n=1 Tax=Marinitoga sp. 1197 TaxID=1428449 RepID=UPI000640DA27|nr:sensor domain-containing diguanylate cyclase [Marinitoga sp. 1197]KLO21510.1 hypothetical protein X275_08995 [Marinitoga sp. 1197]
MKKNIYEYLFNFSNNAIFYWDESLKLIKANKKAAELLGYSSPEKMQGISYSKHIDDTEKEIIQRIKKALKNGELFHIFERKYKTINGDIKWVEVYISPILIEENKYILQEVDYDITERKILEEQLEFEKKKFENYFNLAQTINVVLDKNGNIYDINNKACEILKVKKNKIIGKNWFDNFIPQELQNEVRKVFNKILSGKIEPVEYYENEIINNDGEKIIVSWHNNYIKKGKNIILIFSSGIDVTKEKKYIQHLEYENNFSNEFLKLSNEIISSQWNEQLYQKIIDKLVDIVPSAETGAMIFKNKKYYEYKAVKGFDINKLKTIKFKIESTEKFLFKNPYIVSNWKEEYSQNIKYKNTLIKYGNLEKIKETLIIPLFIKNNLYGFITLDSYKKRFENIDKNFAKIIKSNLEFLLWKLEVDEQLRKSAEYDFLTKIYNRQAFISKIKDIIALEKRLKQKIAFIYMDINKFKAINDTYGHRIGDEVLKFFAERVSSVLRESDMFARIGGDEFIIALFNTDKNGAKKVVNKIKKDLKTPFQFGNIKLNISVSFGYSIYPDDSTNIDKLIDKADKMMYREKHQR